jgi:hypothetical protein
VIPHSWYLDDLHTERYCPLLVHASRLDARHRSDQKPSGHAEPMQIAKTSLGSQDQASKIDIDKRDSGAGLEVSCRIRSAGDGTHSAVALRVMSVHWPSRLENRTGSI